MHQVNWQTQCAIQLPQQLLQSAEAAADCSSLELHVQELCFNELKKDLTRILSEEEALLAMSGLQDRQMLLNKAQLSPKTVKAGSNGLQQRGLYPA